MKLKTRTILHSIGLLVLVIAIIVNVSNPDQRFRLSPKRNDLVSLEKQETEHIIMYGGDHELAEEIYKELQLVLRAFYVNKRVKIYVAKPKWGNGIGYTRGILYAGIYRHSYFGPDTIIYNGNLSTLVHELIHVFTYNMKDAHTSEILARMIPKYQELALRYETLVKTIIKAEIPNEQKASQKTTQEPQETVQV